MQRLSQPLALIAIGLACFGLAIFITGDIALLVAGPCVAIGTFEGLKRFLGERWISIKPKAFIISIAVLVGAVVFLDGIRHGVFRAIEGGVFIGSLTAVATTVICAAVAQISFRLQDIMPAAVRGRREAEALAAQDAENALTAEQARQSAAAEREQRRLNASKREPEIRAFYADRMNTVTRQSQLYKDKTTYIPPFSNAPNAYNPPPSDIHFSLQFVLSRPLSSMDNRDIQVLQFLDLFNELQFISEADFNLASWGIIYNDGNCICDIQVSELRKLYITENGIKNDLDAVKFVLGRDGVSTKAAAINLFFSTVPKIALKHPDHRLVKEVQSLLVGGNNWLSEQTLAQSPFTTDRDADGLFIGDMEDGQRLWFGGESSLITIAPPGSGKTQCHVFPTLLSYRGPAIVLDVKGECFDKTSAWRKANVGPVFKFNPLNPTESARYNPLAFIANDPDTLWEECRLMADLLVIPEDRSNPSWENRARDLVTGVLAWLVRTFPPDKRSMSAISAVVSKVLWKEFLDAAKVDVEIPALSRIGRAFADMPDRQLEGVLDAARRNLAVWEGRRVERVTAACDWTPDVLRDGSNSTIYICIPPGEIETYAPVLRMMFSQHIRRLLSELPPRDRKPILFMLDELPRMNFMRAVEEGLEVGRQYGIRLWMFSQNLGQLENAYRNASGMIGSCGLRIYMNPAAHDGTARRLSEELGEVESIMDSSRHPLVEATALTGPAYADFQIALATSARPAKLKKVFAYRDPEFAPRLSSGTVAASA